MAIEEIKILGAVLELPAKQHCQFSAFGSLLWAKLEVLFTSSSKTIAMGGKPSFEVKRIEI